MQLVIYHAIDVKSCFPPPINRVGEAEFCSAIGHYSSIFENSHVRRYNMSQHRCGQSEFGAHVGHISHKYALRGFPELQKQVFELSAPNYQPE